MLYRENRTLILAVLLFLAAILACFASYRIYMHWKTPGSDLEKDCTAIFTIRDRPSDFYAQLNLFVHMKRDNTGYFDLSGKTFTSKDSYTTARSYSFDIQKQSGSIYHLSNVKLSKRLADNTRDDIMDKLIFSIDSQDGRYVRLTAIDGAYVVGNLYSPAFICIISHERAVDRSA